MKNVLICWTFFFFLGVDEGFDCSSFMWVWKCKNNREWKFQKMEPMPSLLLTKGEKKEKKKEVVIAVY